MRSVFDYLDYRDLLKDAYEEHKAALPLFSYRMMGDRLGLDGSYVFRILQKNLHLPARCQMRTAEYLGLTGRAADYFLLLVAYQRERGTKARQQILEKALALRDVERERLQGKELVFFRHWWVVGVRCLLEVLDGRANPHEIAARLSPAITEKEASEALELLLELGLVRKMSSSRLALAQTHLTAMNSEKAKAVKEFQKQILTLAQESFERFPAADRDISTLTVAVDEATCRDIREMLRESRRQIQKKVEEARSPDRVMQIAMAFFPLAPAQEAS